MILVAGLAVAGLAGIAAAFYFSVRPGSSRTRASSQGRAGGDMDGTPVTPGPGDRSAPRPSRAAHTTHATHATAHAAHAAHGSHSAHANYSAHANHAAHAAHASHADDAAHGADAAQTPKSRRRVGWRKGADVDQELWPAEAFGGVTDEQFWDDLAADKPLATTARVAEPDSGSRKRPHNAVPQNAITAVPQNAITAPDRRPKGSGAYPQSRPGAAERTAIRPVQAAAQPSSAAVRSAPSAARASRVATRPSPIVTQPVQAAYQPAGSRGRQRPGTGGFSGAGVIPDDDPLTSPAYSLRPKGAVDGRSYQPSRRSGGYRSDPLQPGGSWSGPAGSSASADAIATRSYRSVRGPADAGGGASAFSYGAYPELPYNESVQTMSTPPYREMYGYGNPAGPVGDSPRPNGTWGYGQSGGHENQGHRNAYPPANGYWGSYDPRGNGRRLGSRRFL